VPPKLRRVLLRIGIALGALIIGVGGGAVWTDLTQGDPGQGSPQAPTSVTSVSPSAH
jgi:hypothetical protein